MGDIWHWLAQQSWFGSAVGSAVGASVGLFALILGALLNARLNRKRDERLRRLEIDSLRAALGTELRGYSKSLDDRFTYLKLIAESERSPPQPDQLVQRLSLSSPDIYPSVAPQIGMLDPEQAAAVVVAWQEVALVRNLLGAALADIRLGDFDRVLAIQRAGHGLDAAATCAQVADRLIGPEPPPKVREVGPDELRNLHAGKSGGRWRRYQREQHERWYGRPRSNVAGEPCPAGEPS